MVVVRESRMMCIKYLNRQEEISWTQLKSFSANKSWEYKNNCIYTPEEHATEK